MYGYLSVIIKNDIKYYFIRKKIDTFNFNNWCL